MKNKRRLSLILIFVLIATVFTAAFAISSFAVSQEEYDAAGDFPTEAELRLGYTPLLLHLIRAHGVHRILFGSDSPWGDQRADLALLRSLELNQEERRLIEGENARQLLGLKDVR